METEELEYFLIKIKTTLYLLILAICVILSGLVYALSHSVFFGFAALVLFAAIGFFGYRHFLSYLFVDLKAWFTSTVLRTLNGNTAVMMGILDLAVTGRMLPVTRDQFLHCILLEEGHKSGFIHLVKLKECSHILLALHEYLDRNISKLSHIRLTLSEKFELERFRTLKDHLPENKKPPPINGWWFFLLPSEVSKRAVGLGHLVRILLLLYSISFFLSCKLKLSGKGFVHRHTLLATSSSNDPTEGESHTALWTNLTRNLVVCSTYTARANFHKWTSVANGCIEDL
jgi:hypothetical protein